MASEDTATATLPGVPPTSVAPTEDLDELHHSSTDSSSSSISEDVIKANNSKPQRPKLGSRKSSGTIIVPRDSPHVELQEEEYDENDARTMSPRRSSEEIEKMGREAREALIE